MKNILRALCLLLCLIMTLGVFVSCGKTVKENIDQAQNNNQTNDGNKTENGDGKQNEENNTGNEFGGIQPEVVSSDNSYYLNNTIRIREFAADGKIVRENIFNDDGCFMPDERIEYYYDESGKLIRSEMHTCDFELDDFTDARFHLDSYMLYSHDDKGRAITAVMYDEFGVKQNITATLEYFESGAVKKIAYFEGSEHEYSMEFDENGRCVKEYKGLVVANRVYEGDSRNAVSAEARYNDETNKLYMSYSFGYDSKGRVKTVELAKTTDIKSVLTLDYLPVEQGGYMYKQSITYTGVDREKSEVLFTYSSDGYITKFEADIGREKITADVEYYQDGTVKKRVYVCVYNSKTEKDVDEYELDDNGNIVKHTEHVYYDDVLDEYSLANNEYNANNQRTKRTKCSYDANGALNSKYIYENEYSANGAVSKETQYDYGNDDVIDFVYITYADEYREDGTKRKKRESIRYEKGKSSSKTVNVYEYSNKGVLTYSEDTYYSYDENGAEKFSSRSENYYELNDSNDIVKSRTLKWYDEAKYLAGVIERESIEENTYNSDGNEIKSVSKSWSDGKLTDERESTYTYGSDGLPTEYTNSYVEYRENGKREREGVTVYKYERTANSVSQKVVSKILISYDENGIIEIKEENDYGSGGREWEPLSKLYTYYKNGVVSYKQLYEYEYDYESNELVGRVTKTTCTVYDANGNITSTWVC